MNESLRPSSNDEEQERVSNSLQPSHSLDISQVSPSTQNGVGHENESVLDDGSFDSDDITSERKQSLQLIPFWNLPVVESVLEAPSLACALFSGYGFIASELDLLLGEF